MLDKPVTYGAKGINPTVVIGDPLWISFPSIILKELQISVNWKTNML